MVRQSRLCVAAWVAIFLTCLGSSRSFAITTTVQGGVNPAGSLTCSPGNGSGYNLTGSVPVASSAACTGSGSNSGASGSIASGASAGHVGATAGAVTTNNGVSATVGATAIYS